MDDSRPHENKARQRFILMNAMRFSGVLFIALGLYLVLGEHDLSPWFGYLLVVAGMVEFFVMPTYLAKRWRSPDE